MGDDIEALRERLADATNAEEQIDVMCAIAEQIVRTDPAGALELAVKARRMASARRETARTARCRVIEGDCHLLFSRYDRSEQRFRQALELGLASGDARSQVAALSGLGQVLQRSGNFIGALDHYDRGMRIAESCGEMARVARIHSMIGGVHYDLCNHARALEHALHALDIQQRLGDHAASASTLSNIGVIYLHLRDFEHARRYLQMAADLARGSGGRTEMINAYNLGNLHVKLGTLDQSLEQYRRCIELSRSLGNRDMEAMSLSAIGSVRGRRGDLESALLDYQAALDLAPPVRDRTFWNIMASLGEALAKLKRYDEALPVLNEALQGARSIGEKQVEENVLIALHLAYEATGDLANALECFKQRAQVSESLRTEEDQRRAAQMAMRAEIETADRERDTLRLKNEQLEREMERKAKELTALSLHLVEKDRFLDSLKKGMDEVSREVELPARSKMRGLMHQVQGNIASQREWQNFETQFEKVHVGFLKKLSASCAELTRTELKICALLKINMSSKEIADLLCASVRTVESHRLRIRKKLALPADTNLANYFASL